MQGSQERSFSSLHGSTTSVDKGKRKVSDFSNEDGFCSRRSHLARLSNDSESQLRCNLNFLYMFFLCPKSWPAG